MTAIFYLSLKFSDYKLRRTRAVQIDRSESVESHRLENDEISFLKSAKMYQFSLLYVFSRTFSTAVMMFIPFWLEDSQSSGSSDVSRNHLSIIPMVLFLASFVSSVIMDRYHCVGLNWLYFIGSVICIIGCVLIETSTSANLTNAIMYSVACLFGAGRSVTMISSMCLITNMIGKNAGQGGLVYSVVTCADKLISGIAVLIIEKL